MHDRNDEDGKVHGRRSDRDSNAMEELNDITLLINEIELLLSEKRTALSLMRTGIAIFVLPLTVLSVLIATSRFYHLSQVLQFLIPVLLISSGLVILATYLIVRSLKRVHALDRLMDGLKRKSKSIADLVT